MSNANAPSQPPPSYEDAAAQHGAIPLRVPPQSNKPRGPLPLDIPVLNQLRGKRVILASASPRRKQLLAQIGLTNLEILPSTIPENLPKSLEPFEYVLQTAHQKCISVYERALSDAANADANTNGPTSTSSSADRRDPALVIAADTIVLSKTGRILEKPRSEADHISMLRSLRDQRTNKVYTAVCVLAPREDCRHPGYNISTTVEETTVVFAEDVSDELITAYVKTREGVSAAGGFGIQGMGSLLIERIDGSWDNVVGLPVRVTLGLIEKVVLDQGDEDEDDEEEAI